MTYRRVLHSDGPEVTVNVRESRPHRVEIRTGYTRTRRDVLEFPIAEIPIKDIVAIQAAKVEIAKAIAIDIAGGNPGTAQKNAIGNRARLGKSIGK